MGNWLGTGCGGTVIEKEAKEARLRSRTARVPLIVGSMVSVLLVSVLQIT